MRHWMFFGSVFLLPVVTAAGDRDKVLRYLESSQQDWANWKPAQRPGGPCLSCHTGISHVLARRAAGIRQASPREREQVDGVKTRLLADPPQSAMTDAGAEAILNLFWLSQQRQGPGDPVSAAERVALRLLWERQLREGDRAGSWTWFVFDLEPWDSEFSNYFGAALAARALAAYPPAEAQGAAPLRAYLQREAAKQPLHNRLAWIALAGDAAAKPKVLAELWRVQAADGGWTTASLGPWLRQEGAPPDPGSNAYATAWAAFAARESGVACSDPRLARALDWLARRQDPATSAWPSPSMNKVYPADSIQKQFMTHAATGYAAAALIGCGRL